ncbi:hypothetical protein GGR21_004225 [Dysgonomonas hofstadii]|uniref:BT-3987-like N-terminal domain-containing protein n=1 Tax=Dysgonomonas hofstadii TaxID=637886 RepID=A0A840D1T0_9BACT|nr:DUF1735 and LamG domain-containing protein [Dysgonomonas hofstadii]MBB4038293.1 hypothetical protein [Dysgonomonas hofstadii]
MKTNIYLKLSLFVTSLLLLTFTGCNDKDYGHNAILFTGTDANPVVKFVVEEDNSSYIVTVSATEQVAEDVTVNLAIDNSLVEAYNNEYRTSYYSLPESILNLDVNQVVIKAGKAVSTEAILKVTSTADFVDGRVYVIPVTIKEVKGSSWEVLNTSRTIYLRVSRVVQFNSLDMNNTNLYSNYIFDDNKAVDLPNYTYEVKCYINDWHTTPEQISRLIQFTSKTESQSNMLRFGENGQDINSLQWVNPGGNTHISSTRFNTKQWYTISLTFDGNKYVMYVDGVKDSETSGTTSSVFQRIELGMSWESYPTKQYFNGRIAEARVWNRALSTGEIQLGICGVDPESKGLVAYWKFDEGTGHIFHDATGNGYDIDWSNTVRDNTGNGTLNSFDKSSYVNWLFDDENKCSQ